MLENNDIDNISVSIGDIVEELSNLTGIEKENIGVNIDTYVGYWGICTFDEIISRINSKQKNYFLNYNEKRKIKISIYSNKNIYSHANNQIFCYDIEKKFDLNEIQADGKTLKDHSREQLYFDDGRESYYTGIVIDKDIENLNYKVDLEELENIKDSKDFYPVNLFKQIIINIIDNRNNNKQKKLK